jgi:hypothetical protein
MLPFIFGMVGPPPRHILGLGDPLRVVVHASKILQYERGRHQKGQKLTQSSRNRPDRTHPGADDPIPQGNQARARVMMCLESKDSSDPVIDLRTC